MLAGGPSQGKKGDGQHETGEQGLGSACVARTTNASDIQHLRIVMQEARADVQARRDAMTEIAARERKLLQAQADSIESRKREKEEGQRKEEQD
jgi:protein subunit release factor A